MKSNVDGLPIRCVGEWAREKITRLEKYFQIFANGMHKKWSELNYIEIGSGPGICLNRTSSVEFDGTPLTIIKNKAFKYISNCIFIDFKPDVVDVLNQRLKVFEKTNAGAYIGDYTDANNIVKIILDNTQQNNALNLVFIDPTDCSVPFKTIKKIKDSIRSVDFIINVATKTDFNRNVKNILFERDKYMSLFQKYNSFLNSENFFSEEILNLALQDNFRVIRKKFRESLVKEYKSIGLIYYDFKQVSHYYDLLFASAHSTGLSFWKKANQIEPNNQRRLFQ